MMGVAARLRPGLGYLCCLGCLAALAAAEPAQGPLAAAMLTTAAPRSLRGVGGLLTGLVVGAALGGAVGYAAVSLFTAPLSLLGAVGLGVALGGGIGVVTNYLATGDEGEVDETMTVERDPQQVDPTPADLFDDHPDPVLYVADEGHGPVVRAANDAYGTQFDVPVDAVTGAPLDEAVLAGDDTDRVVEAVAADDGLDTVVTCPTADGERAYRLRTVGAREAGYLLYTPRDGETVTPTRGDD